MALAAVALLVCVTYWPVQSAPFVFDDALFLHDARLQATRAADLGAVFTTPGVPRRVGLATFALNHLEAGAFVPARVRSVSLGLHVANGLLLFLLLRHLVRLAGEARALTDLALAAGVAVWWLHPVQTQAVAYAWQRFTPLAAFFFLAALVCLLTGRERVGRRRIGWWAVALLAGLLALGSKENSATLPLFAVLIAGLFPRRDAAVATRPLLAGLVALAITVALAAWFLGPNAWEMIARDSERRGFSPGQRVMTEWRVVVHYASVLAWPNPARLNLDHDWSLSHGLLAPWTTLASLLAIAAGVLGGLALCRRRPLLGLAVLWFFGNLAIESTFIPLDLAFDHRLYLPSMLPLAVGVAFAFEAIRPLPLRACLVGVLVLVAWDWTAQRLEAWRDPVALWQDTANKSPGKARPHWNLGKAYLARGELEPARRATERALEIEPDLTGAINNLAAIEIAAGRLDRARELLERAVSLEPGHVPALVNLGSVWLRLDRSDAAIGPLERAHEIDPGHEPAAAALVVALFNTGRYERAIAVASTARGPNPRSARLAAFQGAAHVQLGQLERGRQALQAALALDPGDRVAREWLARAH